MKPRKKVNHNLKTETKQPEAAKAASAKEGGGGGTDAKTAASAPPPTPARPQKLKVLKKDTKYRGAREAWFARLVEFDGKTEGEFLASAKEKPPALTRNQTPEPPSGWVRFFVREGVLSLQA